MLEALSLTGLTARPRYMGGMWLEQGRNWSRQDTVGLQLLIASAVPPDKAADYIARSPRTLAHRAHDTGLRMPAEWRDLITKHRLREGPRVVLQYPFISKVRGEHADLLAVNSIVPRGLPDHLRGDVCQEIMLSLWMKETSIEELRRDKGLVNKFIRTSRKDNYEGGGYALSLDVPMRDGRSWYDVLPDPETGIVYD